MFGFGFGLRRRHGTGITVSAPVKSTDPFITGTPRVGHTLNLTQGVYSNAPTSITDQWTGNSANIPGATDLNYTLVSGDVGHLIGVNEIASNGGGSATGTATQIGPVLAAIAPSNSAAPVISGVTEVNQTLSCTTGSWIADPDATFAYQWKRGGVAITGATANTYTLVTADLAATITCTVTATNVGGTSSSTSAGVGPIAAATGLDTSVPAPTAAFASGTTNTTYPPSISVGLPAEFQDSVHTLVRQYATTAAFTSPNVLSLTVNDTEAAAFTKVDGGLSAITSGIHYFRYRIEWNSGAKFTAWSNIQGHGSTAAPVISTATTASVNETDPLSLALTANEPCKWAITSGVDMDQFQVAGTPFVAPVLQWFNNGSQTFGSGEDAGADNTYVATLLATDYFGNTASLTETVTVLALDLTPDAFSFTDVSGATASTSYSSNTITLAGISSGRSVSATVAGGQYSLNGGAFTAAGSFTMALGDTLQLKQTSSASDLTETDVTVTIGGVTDIWSVTTTGTFVPSTLFTGSDNGFVLDGTDTTHMWQLITGATAAVVGQPVGRWEDISGKANHFNAAANNTTRPTLTSSGVQFDGSNDLLLATVAVLYAGAVAGGMTIVAYLKAPASGGTGGAILTGGNSASTNAQYRPLGTANTAGSHYRFFVRDDTNTTKLNYESTSVSPWDNALHTVVVTDNGTQIQLTSDGSPGTAQTYAHTTLTLDRTALGGQANAASFAGCTIKKLIAINRALTTLELNNAKAWVAS